MFLSRGRGGSRTTVTSKVEHFVIIVNGWKPLMLEASKKKLFEKSILDAWLGLENVFEIYLFFCINHPLFL